MSTTPAMTYSHLQSILGHDNVQRDTLNRIQVRNPASGRMDLADGNIGRNVIQNRETQLRQRGSQKKSV